MIAIVSSSAPERAALVSLCESRHWASVACDSVRAAERSLRSIRPHVVLTRHRLADGYSDDVMAELNRAGLLTAVKIIVLIESGAYAAQAARQVALGADSVHRDPVRADVLVEYLARYRLAGQSAARSAMPIAASQPFQFAGASIQSLDRTLTHGRRGATLTPREVQLAEFLAASRGAVVTYPQLYSEILGTNFRGDTSNMRVLLGKLTTSFRSVGLRLRDFVEVIPKTGYRYQPAGSRPSPRSR